MSIIMVDCADCYKRADKLAEMAKTCAALAAEIGADNAELSEGLAGYSKEFKSLSEDVRIQTDVWTEFYTHNVRTD